MTVIEHEICTECVMDEDDPEITFDAEGVCNYCVQFKDDPESFGKRSDGLSYWTELIAEFRREGTLSGRKYDCLIGISGGVDSSFLCKVVQASGLKPIVIHVDNGFDSELSVKNMETVISHTGFDFYVIKPDFEAFRSLVLAYLRASVLDTDVPADYLIEAYQYRTSLRYGLRTILTGWNYHSEAFMPSAWTYRNKVDHRNLRNIHNRFGEGVSLKSLPKWGAVETIWYRKTKQLRKHSPLNYVGYTKNGAIEWLKKNWGWKEYRDKHGENIFSRFYQRFILYEKFGIDKRKMHYSNLVRSGGMTREEAFEEMRKPPYDPEVYVKDREYVLSKLRISSEYFDHLMSLPPRRHDEYGTDQWIYNLARKVVGVKRLGIKVLSKVGLR